MNVEEGVHHSTTYFWTSVSRTQPVKKKKEVSITTIAEDYSCKTVECPVDPTTPG